jgi:hypothetical protein
MTKRIRAFLALASVFAAVSASPLGAQASVAGVVKDSSGRPLAHAEVAIELIGRSGVTDEEGRYRLTDLAPGTRLLRVRQVGYRPAGVMITLVGSETTRSDFTLERVALLDTVRVKDKGSTSGAGYASFEDRRRLGLGKFIDSTQLRGSEGRGLGDMLRAIPGIKVWQPPQCAGKMMLNGQRVKVAPPYCVANPRVRIAVSGSTTMCAMSVVLDGVIVYSAEEPDSQGNVKWERTYDLADLSVANLSGVEIYRSLSEVPMQYSGVGSTCGVLMLWTRRG